MFKLPYNGCNFFLHCRNFIAIPHYTKFACTSFVLTMFYYSMAFRKLVGFIVTHSTDTNILCLTHAIMSLDAECITKFWISFTVVTKVLFFILREFLSLRIRIIDGLYWYLGAEIWSRIKEKLGMDDRHQRWIGFNYLYEFTQFEEKEESIDWGLDTNTNMRY
jgi:hypothetical protein